MIEKSKGTHVNIELDEEQNKILTASAKQNERTKRAEARIRLNHHLIHFGANWTSNIKNNND